MGEIGREYIGRNKKRINSEETLGVENKENRRKATILELSN